MNIDLFDVLYTMGLLFSMPLPIFSIYRVKDYAKYLAHSIVDIAEGRNASISGVYFRFRGSHSTVFPGALLNNPNFLSSNEGECKFPALRQLRETEVGEGWASATNSLILIFYY